jgi:hypothetical protein
MPPETAQERANRLATYDDKKQHKQGGVDATYAGLGSRPSSGRSSAYRRGWIAKMKERCRERCTELGACDGSLGHSKNF